MELLDRLVKGSGMIKLGGIIRAKPMVLPLVVLSSLAKDSHHMGSMGKR